MTRAVLAVVVAAAACEPLRTYPLEAQRYDEAADCLDEEGVIDVIEGEAEGSCDGVRCILSLESGDSFVTAHCKAPPGYEDRSAEVGGACELALAAYGRGSAGVCPPPP